MDYVRDVLRPCQMQAWPLMLLRGTELEQRGAELGLIEETILPAAEVHSLELNEDGSNSRLFCGIPHVVASPSFTKQDWLEMGRIAHTLSSK